MERILHQLSKVIRSAIVAPGRRSELIPHVLRDLVNLETRPMYLTRIAYDWCSAIIERHWYSEFSEGLLFTSLEVGFRHLDPQDWDTEPRLAHTEHHLEMVDIVFKSQNSDAIADLLYSRTTDYSVNYSYSPHIPRAYAERLVCLCNLVPFSPRLRQLVIRSVELVGYERFEEVGVERLVELLNHLHVTVEDMVRSDPWGRFLVNILQTSEGTQLLSHWYWELLVELVVSQSVELRREAAYNQHTTQFLAYNPQITAFLTEAQEWSKLECWMGTVWISWPPEDRWTTEEDLSCSMLVLLRQRPGALQKLERWMEWWSQETDKNVPESFQRICKQAQEAAQRDRP